MRIADGFLIRLNQVVCMLMQRSEELRVDLEASCVALLGKKQFKMTILDIAGHVAYFNENANNFSCAR